MFGHTQPPWTDIVQVHHVHTYLGSGDSKGAARYRVMSVKPFLHITLAITTWGRAGASLIVGKALCVCVWGGGKRGNKNKLKIRVR